MGILVCMVNSASKPCEALAGGCFLLCHGYLRDHLSRGSLRRGGFADGFPPISRSTDSPAYTRGLQSQKGPKNTAGAPLPTDVSPTCRRTSRSSCKRPFKKALRGRCETLLRLLSATTSYATVGNLVVHSASVIVLIGTLSVQLHVRSSGNSRNLPS